MKMAARDKSWRMRRKTRMVKDRITWRRVVEMDVQDRVHRLMRKMMSLTMMEWMMKTTMRWQRLINRSSR